MPGILVMAADSALYEAKPLGRNRNARGTPLVSVVNTSENPGHNQPDQPWGCRTPSRIRRHSLKSSSTDSSARRSIRGCLEMEPGS
jgi:hypothetical protein